MSSELEPAEPVLEGTIVGEGMPNGNPAVSEHCGDSLHARCNGHRLDPLRLQTAPCECNCHKPHTVPGFSAGGYVPVTEEQIMRAAFTMSTNAWQSPSWD